MTAFQLKITDFINNNNNNNNDDEIASLVTPNSWPFKVTLQDTVPYPVGSFAFPNPSSFLHIAFSLRNAFRESSLLELRLNSN